MTIRRMKPSYEGVPPSQTIRSAFPSEVLNRYHAEERRHASAILAKDYPAELTNIVNCLERFELVRSEIEEGGGGKSKMAKRFDDCLAGMGWSEKQVNVGVLVGEERRNLQTHKLDFFKSRVAVEVEWNNKDPFFSRDLNAFRMLHELDVISVGVLITRMDELQAIFDKLRDKDGVSCGRKYGASTTHWSKLMPRVQSGGAGTCPLLLIGITSRCYRDDRRA